MLWFQNLNDPWNLGHLIWTPWSAVCWAGRGTSRWHSSGYQHQMPQRGARWHEQRESSRHSWRRPCPSSRRPLLSSAPRCPQCWAVGRKGLDTSQRESSSFPATHMERHTSGKQAPSPLGSLNIVASNFPYYFQNLQLMISNSNLRGLALGIRQM